MKVSKVYITHRPIGKTNVRVVLEVSSSDDAKDAYQAIKERAPWSDISVYGARDLATFRRTQRTMKGSPIVHSVSDFLKSCNSQEFGSTPFKQH